MKALNLFHPFLTAIMGGLQDYSFQQNPRLLFQLTIRTLYIPFSLVTSNWIFYSIGYHCYRSSNWFWSFPMKIFESRSNFVFIISLPKIVLYKSRSSSTFFTWYIFQILQHWIMFSPKESEWLWWSFQTTRAMPMPWLRKLALFKNRLLGNYGFQFFINLFLNAKVCVK